jgi:histidine triad (HIT) family protein
MSEKTIFAKIIDREVPADIVYEDERCLAFRDINPVAPTHILVIPKTPLDRIQHMTEDMEGDVGHLVFAATKIAKQEGLSGYRLVMNNGEESGQTVFHIHLHIIGGRALSWPPG